MVNPLFAADPETPATPTDALFSKLASDDYNTREQATTDLMSAKDLTDSRIEQGFREAANPEVWHRVLRIAMHHYYAALNPNGEVREDEIGALGIEINKDNVIRPDQYPQILQHPAVMITTTRPGFPAHASFRPGDLITAIEGQSFDDNLDSQDFVQIITQRRAGQQVELTMIRDGEKRTLKIRLDSKRRVEDVAQLVATSGQDPMLYPGWQAKLATLLPPQKPSETRVELAPAK